MQLIEEHIQSTLASLASGHVQQDRGQIGGGEFKRPVDFHVAKPWITPVGEIKRQCGIGGRANNVLGLLDELFVSRASMIAFTLSDQRRPWV